MNLVRGERVAKETFFAGLIVRLSPSNRQGPAAERIDPERDRGRPVARGDREHVRPTPARAVVGPRTA